MASQRHRGASRGCCACFTSGPPLTIINRDARRTVPMLLLHGLTLFHWLIIGAIVVVPFWRIFGRAGLNPAFSLFFFVPGIGWLIVYLLLAFLRWPATEPDAGDAP